MRNLLIPLLFLTVCGLTATANPPNPPNPDGINQGGTITTHDIEKLPDAAWEDHCRGRYRDIHRFEVPTVADPILTLATSFPCTAVVFAPTNQESRQEAKVLAQGEVNHLNQYRLQMQWDGSGISTGTYQVAVIALERAETGAYEFNIGGPGDRIGKGAVSGDMDIAWNQQRIGELTPKDSAAMNGDGAQNAPNCYRDGFTFHGPAQTTAVVGLPQSEFAGVLFLIDPLGFTIASGAPPLTRRLERTGMHRIVVSSSRPNETGSYTVTLASPVEAKTTPSPHEPEKKPGVTVDDLSNEFRHWKKYKLFDPNHGFSGITETVDVYWLEPQDQNDTTIRQTMRNIERREGNTYFEKLSIGGGRVWIISEDREAYVEVRARRNADGFVNTEIMAFALARLKEAAEQAKERESPDPILVR